MLNVLMLVKSVYKKQSYIGLGTNSAYILIEVSRFRAKYSI